MKITTRNQHGMSHLLIPVFIVVGALIGAIGYAVATQQPAKKPVAKPPTDAAVATAIAATWSTALRPVWTADGHGGWTPIPYNVTPPDCPDTITLNTPSPQLKKATSVFYPGQNRTLASGPVYQSFGGFRFDTSKNTDVSVTMPFNGYAFRGNRMLVNGETQYSFDLANACGIMVRVGHLRTLSPGLQALADTLPAATATSSQYATISPVVGFSSGDTLATSVGLSGSTPKNVMFDFGVYDLRTTNAATKTAAYKTAHADTAELSYHGICWLNLLSTKDRATAQKLPVADSTAGKISDYCK
jgi:hypothetical protein